MIKGPVVVDPMMAIHIISGFGAIFVGVSIFLSLKEGSNKKLNRFWQLCMLVMLITSFDIQVLQPGSFTPIHGISAILLGLILLEVWAGFNQRTKIEQGSRMLSFFILLLVLAAIVSTAGGVINQWFFG